MRLKESWISSFQNVKGQGVSASFGLKGRLGSSVYYCLGRGAALKLPEQYMWTMQAESPGGLLLKSLYYDGRSDTVQMVLYAELGRAGTTSH